MAKNALLIYGGRVTHIYISKLPIINSDNGLSPTIILTIAGILLIGPPGINLSEILIEIHTFPYQENAFKNVICEMVAILSCTKCHSDHLANIKN